MSRTRWLVAVIVVIAGMSALTMLVLETSALGRVMMIAGLLVIVGAATALAWLTQDVARLTVQRGVVAWVALALGITMVAAFFGVASATMAAHVIAIMFVTSAHDSRIGLWTTIAAVTSMAVLGGSIATGLIDDPGVIRIDGLQPAQQVVVLAAQLGVVAASYVVAMISRKARRASVYELDVSIRSSARREALLDEARAELERSRRVGDAGRFTDQVLGSYRLGMVLGRGAMGEVYEAVHVTTGAEAAVKLVRRESLGDSRALIRFEREASILASLQIPQVVRVLEVGGADAALPYIAMERLRGRDLGTILREHPVLDQRRTIDLLVQVAAGLDAAHAAGIVHRDLKPQNLFWQPNSGAWTIIDFGVARGADDGGTLTADHVVGTPAYMSPEQASRGLADAASDRYSLGVLAFRIITGEHPHRAPDAGAMLRVIVTQPPRLPTQVEPELPAELDPVFAVALARDPADRFASCAELATAIADALDRRNSPRIEARGLALMHERLRKRPPIAPGRRGR